MPSTPVRVRGVLAGHGRLKGVRRLIPPDPFPFGWLRDLAEITCGRYIWEITYGRYVRRAAAGTECEAPGTRR